MSPLTESVYTNHHSPPSLNEGPASRSAAGGAKGSVGSLAPRVRPVAMGVGAVRVDASLRGVFGVPWPVGFVLVDDIPTRRPWRFPCVCLGRGYGIRHEWIGGLLFVVLFCFVAVCFVSQPRLASTIPLDHLTIAARFRTGRRPSRALLFSLLFSFPALLSSSFSEGRGASRTLRTCCY